MRRYLFDTASYHDLSLFHSQFYSEANLEYPVFFGVNRSPLFLRFEMQTQASEEMFFVDTSCPPAELFVLVMTTRPVLVTIIMKKIYSKVSL